MVLQESHFPFLQASWTEVDGCGVKGGVVAVTVLGDKHRGRRVLEKHWQMV